MNNQQIRILNSLKEACSDPALNQSTDAKLKAQLADVGVLATHLLVDLIDVPEIRKQVVSELAAIAPQIEKLFSDRKRNTESVQELARLAATGDPAHFEACMEIACSLQLELQKLASSDANALVKRLALIEGEYGKRILAAAAARTPKPAETATAAAQTKQFDAEKLNQFIIRSFPEEKDLRVVDAKFLSGGSSKYTMVIRLSGVRQLPEELVLRGDSASSAGFGGASAVDEFRLLKTMYEQGVCVAKPLAVETSGDVFGTPFMLVERRPGVMIGHMFHMPPPNRTTGRDIAAKLAAIHRVPIDILGDWMRGAKVSTSTQVAATLEESYKNWQALQRPSPLFESAFKWLRDNVAIMDCSRGLVHGDYGLNNLLIDNERVSAILDWEFMHIGNPAYDLGYFYYMAESLTSWQDFLEAYREAGGTLPSQEELDYSIMFAVARLGVMTCQAEAAYRSGVTDGLFISLAIGRNCHQQSLSRLHALLNKVL